jgi:hypothetical protein
MPVTNTLAYFAHSEIMTSSFEPWPKTSCVQFKQNLKKELGVPLQTFAAIFPLPLPAGWIRTLEL